MSFVRTDRQKINWHVTFLPFTCQTPYIKLQNFCLPPSRILNEKCRWNMKIPVLVIIFNVWTLVSGIKCKHCFKFPGMHCRVFDGTDSITCETWGKCYEEILKQSGETIMKRYGCSNTIGYKNCKKMQGLRTDNLASKCNTCKTDMCNEELMGESSAQRQSFEFLFTFILILR